LHANFANKGLGAKLSLQALKPERRLSLPKPEAQAIAGAIVRTLLCLLASATVDFSRVQSPFALVFRSCRFDVDCFLPP